MLFPSSLLGYTRTAMKQDNILNIKGFSEGKQNSSLFGISGIFDEDTNILHVRVGQTGSTDLSTFTNCSIAIYRYSEQADYLVRQIDVSADQVIIANNVKQLSCRFNLDEVPMNEMFIACTLLFGATTHSVWASVLKQESRFVSTTLDAPRREHNYIPHQEFGAVPEDIVIQAIQQEFVVDFNTTESLDITLEYAGGGNRVMPNMEIQTQGIAPYSHEVACIAPIFLEPEATNLCVDRKFYRQNTASNNVNSTDIDLTYIEDDSSLVWTRCLANITSGVDVNLVLGASLQITSGRYYVNLILEGLTVRKPYPCKLVVLANNIVLREVDFVMDQNMSSLNTMFDTYGANIKVEIRTVVDRGDRVEFLLGGLQVTQVPISSLVLGNKLADMLDVVVDPIAIDNSFSITMDLALSPNCLNGRTVVLFDTRNPYGLCLAVNENQFVLNGIDVDGNILQTQLLHGLELEEIQALRKLVFNIGFTDSPSGLSVSLALEYGNLTKSLALTQGSLFVVDSLSKIRLGYAQPAIVNQEQCSMVLEKIVIQA